MTHPPKAVDSFAFFHFLAFSAVSFMTFVQRDL